MRSVLAWCLHLVVLLVLMRATGGFARSVGATSMVGLAAVTLLAVAVSALGVAFLSRSLGAPMSLAAVRLLPVPLLLGAFTTWRVMTVGGSPTELALAALGWAGGAALGLSGARALGRMLARRQARQSAWGFLR